MASTKSRLRGLVLDSVELTRLSGWPQELVEDYLNILDNLVFLSESIDGETGSLAKISRVTAIQSPYEIKSTDSIVFFDTDDGDITANLLPGVDNREYRLVNVGSSGNRVTVNPSGSELIYGAGSEYIADQESLIMSFLTGEGWN